MDASNNKEISTWKCIEHMSIMRETLTAMLQNENK